jgi:hypothetical protein
MPLSLSGTGSTLNPDFLGKSNSSLSQIVSIKKLDSYSSTIPFKDSFLKIDVEGHELQVLLGADKILRECRPTLFIEIAKTLNSRNYKNPDFDRTLDLLFSLDYKPLVSNGLGSLRIYNPTLEHDGVRMFLFLPKERFYRTLIGLKVFLLIISFRKLASRVTRKVSFFSTRAIRAIRRRIKR